MNSQALPQFWEAYRQLPKDIRLRAVKVYQLWRIHPHVPGLQFKLVGKRCPVYSVRVTDSYRTPRLLESDTIYWFWIGSHDEYERIIKST